MSSSLCLSANPVSAWDDTSVVECSPCATAGCQYRARGLPWKSEYCCQTCEHRSTAMDTGVSSSGDAASNVCHDVDCPRLEADTLRRSWWEKWQSGNCSDSAPRSQAACFVSPPTIGSGGGPAPVVLFLAGNGHVDLRQDFFNGCVDLLFRGSQIPDNCFILAPVPTWESGLLLGSAAEYLCQWNPDTTWQFLVEILRRLGSSRVDTSRIYVTGISMGAAGAWHLALRYGHMIAAIAPISGKCDWPDDSWPSTAWQPEDWALARLKGLAVRAYQTETDRYAGSPIKDIECMGYGNFEEESHDLHLPGMDPSSLCHVRVRRWSWNPGHTDIGEPSLELFSVEGPLMDWGGFKKFSDHCLWYRVYQHDEWALAAFFFRHQVPQERRLHLSGVDAGNLKTYAGTRVQEIA